MKTVVITGGAGGIGSGICRRFAAAGYRVIIGYNRSEESAEALAREIGGMPLPVNVCQSDSVRTFAETVGRADVLVNNAGIAAQKLFTEITEEEWDEMFDVHVKGAFRLCQAFLPAMLREKEGSIVNVASMWGQVGASCEVHYSAAKAALIGMTRALAKELGPSGIRVNCVSPGVIATDMMAGFSEADKRALEEETPLGRMGTPHDVAEAVLYAAEARFLTGQVIAPNGGFVI
ncbi:MAG: SDR family oxidoreductase [Ruminococcaceae bacterium]|nr:SDR family oxidoreductase [Oscillospiraceae bacterium]